MPYTFTPEWEYFDIKKNAPYFGWAMSRMVLHVLTVPEDDAHAIEPLARGMDFISRKRPRGLSAAPPCAAGEPPPARPPLNR